MDEVTFIEETESAAGLDQARRYASPRRQRFDSGAVRRTQWGIGWKAERSVVLDGELNRRVEIDWLKKIFAVRAMAPGGVSYPGIEGRFHVGPHPAPAIPVERFAEDLGERQIMFGREVRRIRIRERRPRMPELEMEELEAVDEGWFLDLPALMAVRPELCSAIRPSRIGGPAEVLHQTGLASWGFPVDVETRTYAGASRTLLAHSGCRYRVIDLNTDPIDPDIFAIPANFRCVNSLAEMNGRGRRKNLGGFWQFFSIPKRGRNQR